MNSMSDGRQAPEGCAMGERESRKAYIRCKGTELRPSKHQTSSLFHLIHLKFLILGIPISNHILVACALSTSCLVGELMHCIQ